MTVRLKDYYRGLPDDHQMPQRTPRSAELAYRRWYESMVFSTYGPQNKKTWDVRSPRDRKRVGNTPSGGHSV